MTQRRHGCDPLRRRVRAPGSADKMSRRTHQFVCQPKRFVLAGLYQFAERATVVTRQGAAALVGLGDRTFSAGHTGGPATTWLNHGGIIIQKLTSSVDKLVVCI